MSLPAGVSYGTVTWTAISAVADAGDDDALPDAVPVDGTVSFKGSVPLLAVGGATAPVTVFLTEITYSLDDSGILRDDQGREGVVLVSTDTVTGLDWQWTASYRLNKGLARGSMTFHLPAGSTVDLTNPTVPILPGLATSALLAETGDRLTAEDGTVLDYT